MKIDFKLDEWQEEVLKAEGNLCICSGRQVGKSQIIAIKSAEYIANNPNKSILIISITEDQAELMIQKIIYYLHDNYKNMIAKGKHKPTKHLIRLINKSEVKCKAVGQYGLGILGLTIDVLVPDEAAYMPEAIWAAATPMLLTTGGQIWLLSTPNTHEGYFYEAYTNPKMGFKTFHVNSEEVANSRPEPNRSIMIDYLEREKSRMTKLQYAQQYLAQFLEELGQLFPDELIKNSQSLQRVKPIQFSDRLASLITPSGVYYLGVDVARMGGDETTFEILEKIGLKFYQRENIMNKYTLTTQTTDKILELDKQYRFKNIYIDDGGLGVGIYDQLLRNPQTRRKIIAINNARRAINPDEWTDERRKKLFKEDLYLNLLRMMESKEIELLDDPEIYASLKSIVYETDPKTSELRIYGRYTHITEGLIRAAWASKDTHLNIWCH